MTNVPGVGFVALLAGMAVLVVLPVFAGLSLLVTRVTGLRIELSLLAVHAVGIVAGVIGLAVATPFGMENPSLSATVGLLKFAAGVLAVGLALAGIAEGVPIVAGASVAFLVGSVPWQRGVWYATAGYAIGGVAGVLVGIAVTGRIEIAAAGAILAAPGALCGLGFERVAARSGRFPSTA